MFTIVHRIATTEPAEKVLDALTTIDGLADWWTTDVSGSASAGGISAFRFGENGGFDIAVTSVAPDHVGWHVVDGPAEWIGTDIDWRITRDGDYNVVLFEHRGWREQAEFMYHCSTKWAVFLQSLKALVETGTGAPAPRDVQISNWH
ncbi:SRPBCC domain-containing protein [Gordonia sp. TBRC 11910]|uniref:SRPBCC domain-containing protein n=1 Tax=Gordonia asplenii TaxID=2725283 RepID=A0A848L0P5_9ACTN|nr:SRPBCC domain-containing protein [Gordonia asplenii]NMO04530.1 SRPBCC domain-containing protein [Gordonia asplenii]